MRKFVTKISTLAMVSIALVGSSTASAHHSYTFTGDVAVFKGIPLNCVATVVKTPDHDPITNAELNTGTVNVSIVPGDANCALLTVTSNPMRYTQGAPDVDGWKDMTVNGLRVTTITIGNCYGNITVRKGPVGPGQWAMEIDTTIPEEFAGGDCSVLGLLET